MPGGFAGRERCWQVAARRKKAGGGSSSRRGEQAALACRAGAGACTGPVLGLVGTEELSEAAIVE